jgi:hypothetical protein
MSYSKTNNFPLCKLNNMRKVMFSCNSEFSSCVVRIKSAVFLFYVLCASKAPHFFLASDMNGTGCRLIVSSAVEHFHEVT